MTRRLLTAVLAGALLPAVAAGPAAAGDGCPDALITANVKTRLLADDGLGAFKINVETDSCVVTLNGCVDTRAQIRRARQIAHKVRKVREVRSNLTLCPDEDRGKDDDKGD
jgi:osmotically-inducible protein OsmY